jgi:hypothetical protein
MAGKGPAPTKPNDDRRKQKPKVGFTQLPYEGRQGDAPAWPLIEAAPEELARWQKLWSLPQAVMWERMRCEDTVALYVRAMYLAEDHDNVKWLTEVRQLDAKLGLSPRSMLDLRWEIEAAPSAEDSAPATNGHRNRTWVPRSEE